MSYYAGDTICAISSAGGGAGRGIVRVSGPAATTVTARMFRRTDGRKLDEIREPTVLSGNFRVLMDSSRLATNPSLTLPYRGWESDVPCDLFLWPTNRSYTREPVAELHTVGSPPVLQAILSALCQSGARLAEPGEFTLRAFLAGRLDLTQAEAVLGIIDAGGEDELHTALAQLAGGLARPLHQLREDLVQLLAELEAGLDFVEEDIRFVSQQDVLARLETAAELLGEVSQQMESRHSARELPQVVLVGAPNVGKSSLFNALVHRYGDDCNSRAAQVTPALVSPHRGTTRDYLTADLSFGRLQCELVDTAGIENRESAGRQPIEEIAQSVAAERHRQATVRVFCVEAGDWGQAMDAYRESGLADCEIVAVTKADLGMLSPQENAKATEWLRVPVVTTSSLTGVGVAELCELLQTVLACDNLASGSQAVHATAERCRESVRLATSAIAEAMNVTRQNAGDELIATEVRMALAELGKVVGVVYTDDLLDRIFKTFCIGK